ncbi:uncharacterized protein LOC130678393 [Microplitis mediator]|uniref:uncharacterized protein LOC130678393 n=1 Tax=Microplitis mediator TaxID=375433 RepID=UPI002555B391|nr:uncharacterized protein LOC130678393 [Microplitis mediator]
MRGVSLRLLLLLLWVISLRLPNCLGNANKTERATKSRLRSSQPPWRLVTCLSHSQSPTRTDVQQAWEQARLESIYSELEMSYIEGRMTSITDPQSYPLALINKFCTVIENSKVILSLVIGGGSAARFLITAAASLNIPSLWLPMTHRDFLRQGKRGRFETRLGSGSEQIGASAIALMEKAHWHAFTLFIDTTLLPIHHFVPKNHDKLLPRKIIYLPTSEKSLKLRLRKVSDEGGSGSVIVLACDLNGAKKILYIANKYQMLNGRFLWLWLDLKAELRPNEPSLISSHIMYSSALTSVKIENNPSVTTRMTRHTGGFFLNDETHLPSLSNLANDIHNLQEYRWQHEKPIKKREDKTFVFDDDEEARISDKNLNSKTFMPVGMLALRPSSMRIAAGDAILSRMLRETSQALDNTFLEYKSSLNRLRDTQIKDYFFPTCFFTTDNSSIPEIKENISKSLTKKLRESMRQISHDKAEFQLLNLQALQFPGNKTQLRWTKVGSVRGGKDVRLDTITWPGGGIVPAYMEQSGEKIGMPWYQIVTAVAPPFIMVTNLQQQLCLRGLPCRKGETIKCCYGFTIDLLSLIARELNFRFDLYVAPDGLFGRKNGLNGTWNGVIGELLHGRAQLAFAPISVSARRAEVIDFTIPYYFSGVSFLAAPKTNSHISLLAFLLPFSTNLWIAIFTSLNITAVVVALFEWHSPFGLNPWGRQRNKNFSMASALWVMWGLLCGHLVAFKAPKSWPNKVLINVWGGFSVIFVASYTANIAALIAGLFFHSSVSNYHDRSLLLQKVGAPRASVAEYYVQKASPGLWTHMSRFSLSDVAEGVERLLNGSLDILIADTPILDYYRATDDGCRLSKIGETINEDTYAVALTKGHPLQESISKVIANYTANGMLDILQEKWYGGLPCIAGQEGRDAVFGSGSGGHPRPLGVRSVAGVFCLLGLGIVVGGIILVGEYLFFKYTLPSLRHRPKTSIWRNRNVMFFSQKLYRFINCVELVSPRHAARELVHTVKQGHITSLFQKSVKRKEHERRRRKSRGQFFEMIQEIRRVQQEVKEDANAKEVEANRISKKDEKYSKEKERSRSKSPLMPLSPKRPEKSRSSINLSSSRLGLSPINLETSMKPREFTLSSTNLRARSPLETVGRRLSHGDDGSPPPRLSTANFGGSVTLRLSPPVKSDSISGGVSTPKYSHSPAKRGQSFPVFATLKRPLPLPTTAHPSSHHAVSKSPLLSPNNELTAAIGRKLSREWGSGTIDLSWSSEAIGSFSTYNPSKESTFSIERPARKKNQEDLLPLNKKPVRRARSHENRDTSGKSIHDSPPPRLMAQPSVGGRSVSERTKKQLESELKAILTARAHHRDLHPP